MVSVIIPTYNRKHLLREAVWSVLEQDLDRFEVVVVDDGSTDGTAESVRGLDPRVRCITQENQRRGRARNRGLEEARGRFVAFLDDDDRFEPWHLSQAAEALRPDRGGASAPTAMWDPATGKTRDITPPESAWLNPAEASLDGMVFPLQSLIVPKDLALECGGFPDDASIDGSEDLVFLIRLTVSCPLRKLPRRSVLIREHQARGMKSSHYIIQSRKNATDLLLREGRCGHPLRPEEVRRLQASCHRFAAALLYEQGAMREARAELNVARRTLGGLGGARATLPLQMQSYLGARGSRLARRLKQVFTWR